MDAYLFGRELTVMNHSITFSSIRSDINQINKYKIELVFFPYDIVFYFYGHSQKKDGNTRAIFAPSAPSFSPYLFVMRQLLIIKRNMVF